VRREAALIVGGGPAGSAAAIRLQRAGARPLLLERTREPADALCGGFMSWATVAQAAAVGLDVWTLGAHPIERLRLVAAGRTVEAALPARAAGLSRLALDAALIARVERVERGVSVREGAAGHVRLGDGAGIDCDALFLATGKHELRGLARPAPGGDPAIGLRARVAATPGLAGVIELHAFDRGYAGLLVQEDGMANLCMAVRRSRLTEAGSPEALLAALGRECPALGDRLGPGTGAVQAVANVPYGWRATTAPAGLFRLGDQAGVIPSLAGEGMGIALASAEAAVAAWSAGASGYQPDFARRLRRPFAVAGALKALAEHPSLARPLLGLAPLLAGPMARLTRI
jgi:flavin-dependent dehydrogenase